MSAEAAVLASSLAQLYQTGSRLGASLVRGTVTASSSAVQPAGRNTAVQGIGQVPKGAPVSPIAAYPHADSMPSTMSAVAQLLQVGCLQGSLMSSVFCGLLSAGLLDGVSSQAAQSQHLQQQAKPQQQQHHQQILATSFSTALAKLHQQSSDATGQSDVASGSLVHSTVVSMGHGCLGCAYAKLFSTHGERQPVVLTVQGVESALHGLMHHGLSLSGMCYHAVAGTDAAAATTWLRQQSGQLLPQEMASLTRFVADWGPKLQVSNQLDLCRSLHHAAAMLADGYGYYALRVDPQVMGQLDGLAVKSNLDKAFAAELVMMQSLWAAMSRAKAGGQQPNMSDTVHPATPADMTAKVGSVGIDSGGYSAQCLVQLLLAISHLQFCRLQLPQYTELLQALVTALASNPAACDLLLKAGLPCYDHLTQPAIVRSSHGQQKVIASTIDHPAAVAPAVSTLVALTGASDSSAGSDKTHQQHHHEPGTMMHADQPASAPAQCTTPAEKPNIEADASAFLWEVDTVLAARLAFLLPLVPVAWRQATDPTATAQHILPMLMLLLQHPVSQLSLAAHSAYASLVAGCTAAGCQDVMEHSVPFYLRRSLGRYPERSSIDGLKLSWHYLLNELPGNSLMALLCVSRVVQRMQELLSSQASEEVATTFTGLRQPCAKGAQLNSQEQVQQQHLPVVDPQQQQAIQSTTATVTAATAAAAPAKSAENAATSLFGLLQQAALVIDYQLLPTALELIGQVIRAAPSRLQTSWVNSIYDSLLRSEDYARKAGLLRWLHRLYEQNHSSWITAGASGAAPVS